MTRFALADDYWSLVHQLMIHGWYRVGQGPADDYERTRWGFREGHLRDVQSWAPLWIPARDERTAMRILLREVESALADRASLSSDSAATSPSAPHIPDSGGRTPLDFAAP